LFRINGISWLKIEEMMDLKRKLISEIEKIDNNDILRQLSELLIETEGTLEVQFSENQIEKIKESQSQIEKGESFDHKNVMNMLND
jgi:hypothetical protein